MVGSAQESTKSYIRRISMGYYASGYGTITIRADYDTPTLQKLYKSKTLDFRDGLQSLILKSARTQWI